MQRDTSSLVMVVHCYDQIGYSSLWFLKGVTDPRTNDSVDLEDYHKHYLLIADHFTNKAASDLADNLIKIFESLGVDVKLFGLPDD